MRLSTRPVEVLSAPDARTPEALLPNLRRRANRRLAHELLQRTLLTRSQTVVAPALHPGLLRAISRDRSPIAVAFNLI